MLAIAAVIVSHSEGRQLRWCSVSPEAVTDGDGP